jgi:hypothetical protein
VRLKGASSVCDPRPCHAPRRPVSVHAAACRAPASSLTAARARCGFPEARLSRCLACACAPCADPLGRAGGGVRLRAWHHLPRESGGMLVSHQCGSAVPHVAPPNMTRSAQGVAVATPSFSVGHAAGRPKPPSVPARSSERLRWRLATARPGQRARAAGPAAGAACGRRFCRSRWGQRRSTGNALSLSA